MNPVTYLESQNQTPGLCSRLAWLPIPLIIAAIVVLKALDWQTAHESEILLMVFNFAFSTLASLLVVVLFGRSFLARGAPGMLLFGCGVLLWGAAGTLAPALMAHGINVMISVHNILVCLSALCQLAGAILLLKPRTPFREAGPPLCVAQVAALGVAGLVAVLALGNGLPVFFVQGVGGTPLRYGVLASATVMFAGAAALLWTINRHSPTVFVRWYGRALLLVATGLFGIMIESVHGGALSWTGRAAQFLGGAYMLVAALASVRESGAWKVTLSEALEHAREAVRVSEERYRMLFDAMTEGFALHEIITDGSGRPCDYRFLDVNPAFERLTGLKRADLIGKRVLDVMPDTESHWIENYGKVALTGEALHMENYSATLKRWYEVYAYRVEPDRFAVTISDITERKRAEEALQEREAELREAQRVAHIGNWYWNAKTDATTGSDELLRIYGFDPATDNMPAFREQNGLCYPTAEWERINEAVHETLRTGVGYKLDVQAFRGGAPIWLTTRSEVVLDTDGQIVGLLGTVQDITERKEVMEALKASLSEKEVLLKEIHHRVKNNMQVISSLVSLQADGSKDETVREVLKDVTYRVRSMALVHEKLYQSNDLARIDFAEYVRSLLSYLWRAHGDAAASVRLTLDLEPVSLPVDTAVPCGLILNELAGNALKHAFRGRSEGEVTVSLQNSVDGRIRLSLADNGVGLPPGFDWREAPSLGLNLVRLLSKQLVANVEVSGEEGTRFEIVFQVDRSKAEG
jgi:PAS domain S-box-containing protein